jgi:16S rRNA (guanine527-N7)-methyltransferase
LGAETNFNWFASMLREHVPSITLSSDQMNALYAHYELLTRWNSKINLTSIRSPEEIVVRHYCESLFFGAHLPDAPAGTAIADIGSGPGFPGVPMAVLKPDWHVSLVESHQRKAVFLRESTRSLKNVSVIAERAEQVNQNFDWLVARAVTPGDIVALSPKLADRVGLLIGEADFRQVRRESSFAWSEPVRVPWGDYRLCVFAVPRETSGI